jgi:hypothetical protein
MVEMDGFDEGWEVIDEGPVGGGGHEV